MLRVLMEAMGHWLETSMPVEVLRACAASLGVALEDHAQREERYMFGVLPAHTGRTASSRWRRDISMLRH